MWSSGKVAEFLRDFPFSVLRVGQARALELGIHTGLRRCLYSYCFGARGLVV